MRRMHGVLNFHCFSMQNLRRTEGELAGLPQAPVQPIGQRSRRPGQIFRRPVEFRLLILGVAVPGHL